MKYQSRSLFGAAASAVAISLFTASSMMVTGTQAVPFAVPSDLTERGLGKGDIRTQKAAQELVMISIPEGTSIADAKGQYAYDHSAGKGVDVYVIDTGALISHQEFTTGKKPASRARWIFTNPDKDQHEDDGNWQKLEDRMSGKCHGTGMLDKVVGNELGVAKKINPVIVKVPGERWTSENPTRDEYLRGVELTLEDIKNKENPANSVVSMSWYYPNEVTNHQTGEVTVLPDDFKNNIKDYITQILELGATVVVAAGNDGLDTIDGYPAILGSQLDNLIVVGAVDYSGARWRSTSGSGSNLDATLGLPHVYAVGAENAVNGIKVASCIPGNPFHSPPGTSPATASVAGLAAYLKGHPGFKTDSPAEVKSLILDMAYARGSDDTLKAVWNGVQPISGSCAIQRRDPSTNYTDCLPAFEDSGMAKLF